MSKITDIRSNQVIDFGGDKLAVVISAALEGKFTLHADGAFTLEPWRGGLSQAGEVFRSAFFGRRFASLESAAACALDVLMEQVMLHEDGAHAKPADEEAKA